MSPGENDILIKLSLQLGEVSANVKQIKKTCASRLSDCNQRFARQEQTGRINTTALQHRVWCNDIAVKTVKLIAGAVGVAGIIVGMAAALGLLGCTVPHQGLSVTAQSTKYTLNTKAKCIEPVKTMRLADRILPVVLDEISKAGLIDYQQAVNRLKGRVMVCMIPRPEPCCAGTACAGPFLRTTPARKAGCTVWTSIWVSKTWPPSCSPEWPEEPHCDSNETHSIEATMVHELIEVVGLVVMGGVHSGDHKRPLFQKIEPAILKRLGL